ncbi:MAG: hypothetical protein LBI69_03070 [Puniceicoccales bacterium]|jgi:hypothetical protein|nr:hypothetical protein [Puniceicoccales bacterium]
MNTIPFGRNGHTSRTASGTGTDFNVQTFNPTAYVIFFETLRATFFSGNQFSDAIGSLENTARTDFFRFSNVGEKAKFVRFLVEETFGIVDDSIATSTEHTNSDLQNVVSAQRFVRNIADIDPDVRDDASNGAAIVACLQKFTALAIKLEAELKQKKNEKEEKANPDASKAAAERSQQQLKDFVAREQGKRENYEKVNQGENEKIEQNRKNHKKRFNKYSS